MVYINFTYMYILYDIHIESSPCLQRPVPLSQVKKFQSIVDTNRMPLPLYSSLSVPFFSPPSPLLPDKAGTGV